MKDLLRIADLGPDDLERILNLASAARRAPHTFSGVLTGDMVACLFAQPSVQTRLSFGAAIARLGGIAHVIEAHELPAGSNDVLANTARVVGNASRAFVVRTADDADLELCAAAASVPVVNARTALHHPLPAIADLLTLRGHFGGLAGLHIAFLGDGRVAHSLIEGCALAGVDVVVASPTGREPRLDVVDGHGGTGAANVTVTDDPRVAVAGVDAVLADAGPSSAAQGRDGSQRAEDLGRYVVTDALMSLAAPHAVFLHRGPASRDAETLPLVNGPRSLVVDQAANRIPVAVGALVALLDGSLRGSSATRQAAPA
jgi:ornithine carbamoyltransferase